jgi:hypothetical protein
VVLSPVNQGLGVLNAHTNGNGSGDTLGASLVERPVCVTRRVARRNNHRRPADLAAIAQANADTAPALVEELRHAGVEADLRPKFKESFPKDRKNGAYFIGPQVGVAGLLDLRVGSKPDQALENIAQITISFTGIDLAVGERACAPLSKHHVAFRVQGQLVSPTLVDRRNSILHRLASLNQQHSSPGLGEAKRRKKASGSRPDHDRPHI